MEQLRFRALTATDLDTPLFPENDRPHGEDWLVQQGKDEVYIAVAESDGVPVGRLGMNVICHYHWDAAYLWAAYVLPAYRGRGVGTALVAHLEEQARARGCWAVTLCVEKGDERGRRFYERLGYRVRGESTETWTDYEDGHPIERADPCWDLEKELGPGAGLFDGLPRWVAKEVQTRLAERMAVPPPDPWDQDWEWTVADESRFWEWRAVYDDPDLSDDERMSLMETLIDCANGAEESMREALRPLLLARPTLHAHTVHYWCAWDDDGDPDNGFAISPWMRAVWAQMRPALAAARSRIQHVAP